MRFAVLLFLVCSLKWVVSLRSKLVTNEPPSPPNFDHFYKGWLNTQLARFGKNKEIFVRRQTQILWNSTKYDEFNMTVKTSLGPINLKLKRMTLEGFSEIVVRKLATRTIFSLHDHLEGEKLHYNIVVQIPKLRVSAEYHAERKSEKARINCRGMISHAYENVMAELNIYVKRANNSVRAEVTNVDIIKIFVIDRESIQQDDTPCDGFHSQTVESSGLYTMVLDELKLLRKFEKKIQKGLNELFSYFNYHSIILGTVEL